MAAKRNSNDRNEKALRRYFNGQSLDEVTLADGTVITLKDIDPLFVQSVINSVKFPKRPTYEVTLASGRIENYPMDEKVAKQTPELKPLWDNYVLAEQQAEGERIARMNRAIMLDGTVRPQTWSDPAWERRMRIVGVPIPDDPEEAWVFYLESKMTAAEVVNLTTVIMRRTGVPEEFITAAEDSFRGAVHSESAGQDDVVDADGHARAVGEEETREVVT